MDKPTDGEHKLKFENELKSLILRKREDNSAFFNQKQYEATIEEVKRSKAAGKKGNDKLLRKYEVISEGGKDVLIRPVLGNFKKRVYYARDSELFDILQDTHLKISHGGRNKMNAMLKRKYANITQETIMLFLRTCPMCQMRIAFLKKSIAPKEIEEEKLKWPTQTRITEPFPTVIKEEKGFKQEPMLEGLEDSKSRPYFNLVEPGFFTSVAYVHMVERPLCNNYKYILVFQNKTRQFFQLRALKIGDTSEVCDKLKGIFLALGTPKLLCFSKMPDDVRFNATELSQKLRIPVEFETLKELYFRLEESETQNWPAVLPILQYRMNVRLKIGISEVLYEPDFQFFKDVRKTSLSELDGKMAAMIY